MTLVAKEVKKVMMRPWGVETKIRPVWWEPWANTVAYRPLNSTTTVNDLSWNNYTLTQNWWIFTTVDGIDCYSYNWGGYLQLSSAPKIPSWNSDRTIHVRVYPRGYSSSYVKYFLYYGYVTTSENTATGIAITTQWRPYTTIGRTGVTWYSLGFTNIWSLLTMTLSGVNIYLYQNGVLQWSDWASSRYPINTPAISSSVPLVFLRRYSTDNNGAVNAALSEVIIEDRTRTAQEIADYYNLTKSKYWAS